MKVAYNHLVQYISENPSIEQMSNSLFQLGHEHEISDNIFDIEFTPNRGDCLSINGLLRDLAVFYKVELSQDIYTGKLDDLEMDFENLSESICPQISFLKLEIDQVPEIYKDSLDNYFLDLNLNKNNFFTDVSNYISYETGQPTHCYDANTINGKLLFHEIEKNEEFETLLDRKITLSNKNAVFSLNNEVINLAGLVGGKSTSCSVDTKTVIVECAFYQPESIIGKSVKYDIQSEAAHKFERGVDPKCHNKVLRRFINIVNQHTNIKAMSIISYKFKDNLDHLIPVNVQKINQIIGIDITENEYLNYLSKLGFDIKEGFIKVPSFRSDIRTDNDLAEEVARVIGYNNIAASEISIPKNKKVKHGELENKLRHFLLDHGFYEVINPPFVGSCLKDSIKVDNPLDSNREYLRTNIMNSLIDNLLYNERRQKDSIKLYEISDIYSSNNGISRKRKLSIIASGRVGLNYEEFSKKINKKYLIKLFQEILPSDVSNFNILPRDSLDTKVKNDIFVLEVDIEQLSTEITEYIPKTKIKSDFIKYTKISDYPKTYRDISYSSESSKSIKSLEILIDLYETKILKEKFIFDYYKNPKNNIIKIGFRFIFQSDKKTLTDSEVDEEIKAIIELTLAVDKVTIPGL